MPEPSFPAVRSDQRRNRESSLRKGKERKEEEKMVVHYVVVESSRIEGIIVALILSMVEGFNRLGRRCGERGIERPPLGSVPA